jgi:hypothetical protein
MNDIHLRGIGLTLKRKLLKVLGVLKQPNELEQKLKGATDIYDVERRLQQYERDPGYRVILR